MNRDKLASCWSHYGAASIVFPTCAELFNSQGPHFRNYISYPLLKPPTEKPFHLGIVRNLGHCVGCVQCVTLGWALETGRLFFFFLFRLLNPTSSGKEPATDIIRWILKRTKAPLQFFTLPVERKKQTETKPIQHRYPACVCMCVCACL